MKTFALFIILTGILALWALSAIMLYKTNGRRGLKVWGANLGLFIAIAVSLWFVIVYPGLKDCSFFLCGWWELTLFLLIAMAVFLIWSVILFFYARKIYGRDSGNSRVKMK